ncbi:nucleic acid-binding protein [Vararia minispora EC-137]|uniref:Nucleic acid-binding protein n=1 Tax=Vararia minispora EC-137 TaxID=1314806 RepID=A0ACB8Q6L7_9AGAM|nr:nucleic acid-binding protein [Vararia minispora EC-137]
MVGKKRQNEDPTSAPKPKKAKVVSPVKEKKERKPRSDQALKRATNTALEEIDFPRGGGTNLTPLEVKTLRAEAVKEANDELFKENKKLVANSRKRRKSDVKDKGKAKLVDGEEIVRIEHLNYKRVAVGQKIFAQVMAIQPLALIVSLPNQLAGHVPITQISPELTKSLETMDVDSENEDNEDEDQATSIPDLHDLYQLGQYVRCIVTTVHIAGTTEGSIVRRSKDDIERASWRVELSLSPELVNEGVSKADIRPGFSLTASVKSIEDHGYILNLGIADVSGFLSFKDAKKRFGDAKLHIGRLLDVVVSKLSSNGRTCNVTASENALKTASITEVSSVSSVLPGQLVQCLVTSISSEGLAVQALGFFVGTIDEFHIPSGDPDQTFKLGQKLKARVLYQIAGASPPRFALSLAPHILSLTMKQLGHPKNDETGSSMQEAFPVGTILESVKVAKVESERGLIVQVQGLTGFVHISHVSDEHIVSLSPSSGAWRVDSTHRARVTGYFPLDGLLQLSMRSSVLEQRFLQVDDVQPGELMKGVVKRLTVSALFVSISGSVDGAIFPNHYADIPLKQPQRRFKPGASIKCRVLIVDADRKRIVLTAKKTLVESDLPLITSFEEAKVGMITHAVVFRIAERRLQIEFFNNVKGSVPIQEAIEGSGNLTDAFTVGKPIRVRVTAVHADSHHVVASILQASATYEAPVVPDINSVEVGSRVEGTVAEVHKDNTVLALQPSGVRALLSLKNLANQRKVPVAQMRGMLKAGDKLDDLFVVTREPEKGFVIVAGRPKAKQAVEQKQPLKMDAVQVGQIVSGRVVRQLRNGTLLKLSSSIMGVLHPTDVSDDYESGVPFPTVDNIVRAAVVAIDSEKKQLTLSSRASRMEPDSHPAAVDPEIKSVDDLKVGRAVRGFVKSVAEHGLFVGLSRDVDARVQIKELFDEYVKDWKPRFQINQLVKGRVLSVDREKKFVELTFRSGDLSKLKSSLTLSDLHAGQKVEGRVKKIEDYGLFIEIKDSRLSGLCHKSELSDNKDADTTLALRSFRVGDTVKAVICAVNLEKKRVNFSLKPSNFSPGDFGSGAEEGEDDVEQSELGVVQDAEMSDAEEAAENDEDESEEDSDGSDGDEDAMAVDMEAAAAPIASSSSATVASRPPPVPSLQLRGGFQWNGGDIGTEDDDDASSGSDSDGGDDSGKKRRKKKKQVELDLTADLQTKMPDSNADFERVLLGSPNSSYLWIQYMSFLLQLADVDKAREVGKRAVKTISFREEQERLNVWIALLNLENVYGTDESLDTTFKDAARHCDSKTVHLRLATIFEQSEKFEMAEEQFKKTAKKFGYSSKVWTLWAEFYMNRGQLEEARKLLPRCLQSLEKRKHLKTISRFAQLEYKLGDPERGKTIFEGIVDSHPKRWDMWSVYMDMEAGQQDVQSLRSLFTRVLAFKMTSHKAKAFFKKWLDIERKIGDEEGAENVKQKAIEWTQRAAGNADADE